MATRIKSLDGGSIAPAGNPIEQIRRGGAVGSQATGSQANASTSASGDADSVTITDSARTLATLAQSGDTPEVDTAKVAALQSAIDSGQYTIDAGRIADGLMQMDQMLGTAAQ